jgi:shikimate 5-dehydrogenase
MPYRRDNETTSVISARENSIQAENGLAMLVWQGAKSLSIWTGKQLYGSLMLNTLKEHLYGHK